MANSLALLATLIPFKTFSWYFVQHRRTERTLSKVINETLRPAPAVVVASVDRIEIDVKNPIYLVLPIYYVLNQT